MWILFKPRGSAALHPFDERITQLWIGGAVAAHNIHQLKTLSFFHIRLSILGATPEPIVTQLWNGRNAVAIEPIFCYAQQTISFWKWILNARAIDPCTWMDRRWYVDWCVSHLIGHFLLDSQWFRCFYIIFIWSLWIPQSQQQPAAAMNACQLGN